MKKLKSDKYDVLPNNETNRVASTDQNEDAELNSLMGYLASKRNFQFIKNFYFLDGFKKTLVWELVFSRHRFFVS